MARQMGSFSQKRKESPVYKRQNVDDIPSEPKLIGLVVSAQT